MKRDSRIRLLRQMNGGHGAALNRAFAACRGEVICLLDSDDLFLPEKLERVVSQFRSEPGAGVAVHRVIRVNEMRRAQGVCPCTANCRRGGKASGCCIRVAFFLICLQPRA